ncbi:MAG: hypothetical protein ACI4D7_07970 [Lachnospiraceae bacterium]
MSGDEVCRKDRPSVLNLCQRVYRVKETRVTELSEEESARMVMDF